MLSVQSLHAVMLKPTKTLKCIIIIKLKCIYYRFRILWRYSRHICSAVFSSSQVNVARFSRRCLRPRDSSDSAASTEACFSSFSSSSSSADSLSLSSSFLYTEQHTYLLTKQSVQPCAMLAGQKSVLCEQALCSHPHSSDALFFSASFFWVFLALYLMQMCHNSLEYVASITYYAWSSRLDNSCKTYKVM